MRVLDLFDNIPIHTEMSKKKKKSFIHLSLFNNRKVHTCSNDHNNIASHDDRTRMCPNKGYKSCNCVVLDALVQLKE